MTDKHQPSQELDYLAQKIDDAITARDQLMLTSLTTKCDELYDRSGDQGRLILHYMASNALSALQSIKNSDEASLWSWEQPETVQAILRLRRAMIEPGYKVIDPVFKARIVTNLANLLNQLGRPIEAIELWDEAISYVPNFAMARGNKGLGLIRLAQLLCDDGHQMLLLEAAEQSLTRALDPNSLWDSGEHPEARVVFEARRASVSKSLDAYRNDLNIDRQNFSLGETPSEISYRTWCLQERLFLNPLNDIMDDPLAAQDVFHLPSHSYKLEEAPRFPNYYNLLKQEYASARYRLFKSLDWDIDHPADRDVMLIDGTDAGIFGHPLDDLRIAFREAYSLFDKISVFLGDYFGTNKKNERVTFRRVFEQKPKNADTQLRPAFQGSQNLPLRGLYFLAKDLFDKGFDDFAAPDAKQLVSLRNQLEHRYLTLQFYPAVQTSTEEHLYISIDVFRDKTLSVLRLARSALIYLSLAMGSEEARRRAVNDKSDLSISIPSRPIEK